MGSIFEISAEMSLKMQEVQQMLDDGIAPDSDEFQAKLQEMVATEGDLKDKVVRIAYVIKREQADLATVQDEIDRLTKIKKQKQTTVDNLSALAMNHMLQNGVEEASNGLIKVAPRLNKWSVTVENPESLPPEYQRIKTEITANKIELLAHREELDSLGGVTFQRTYSLQIK